MRLALAFGMVALVYCASYACEPTSPEGAFRMAWTRSSRVVH